MAWKIARTTEIATVAVVLALAGAGLWNAWRAPEDITGTIVRPLKAPAATRQAPVVNAVASVPPMRAPQINLVAHIIEPRETMKSIALRFNTPLADLATVNRMTADARLNPGEILVVPVYR
jgi:hypothetical protein